MNILTNIIFKHAFICCVLMSSIDIAFSATITTSHNAVHIDGKIEKGDYSRLKSFYLKGIESKNDNHITNVYISSPGGDFIEAINIANFIEKLKLTVRVPENKICNSACIFIVIGGAQRVLMGNNLGLHRPYIVQPKYGTNKNHETENAQISVMKIARQWLNERFVPAEIIDSLILTPSFKIKYIDSIDFLKKVGFRSPIHQEWLANLCGYMTEQESMLAANYPKYYLYKEHGSEYIRSRGWSDDLVWIKFGEESGRIEVMKAAFDKQNNIIECEVIQVKKHIKSYLANKL